VSRGLRAFSDHRGLAYYVPVMVGASRRRKNVINRLEKQTKHPPPPPRHRYPVKTAAPPPNPSSTFAYPLDRAWSRRVCRLNLVTTRLRRTPSIRFLIEQLLRYLSALDIIIFVNTCDPK